MDLTNRKRYPIDPHADPVEEAEQLRALGQLVAVELPGGVPAWAATDLATAQRALGHEDLTKDPAYWPALADGRIADDWELIALVRGAGMLHLGGADHRRLRQLVSSAFARAPIEALRPRIEQTAEELLDRLAATSSPDGTVDLREQFAFPLPVAVICHVLGVPDSAVGELRSRFDRLVTPQKGATGDDDIRVAVADIYSSLSGLIDWKRTDPGDDLTTALIQARDEGDRLSEQELVETLFLVLIAGHETTINSITNTVHALLRHPVMLAAARGADDGETWANVVEEGLRYSPPVRHVILRYAVKDTEIAGVRVAKGDAVLASLVPAGRDPGRHEQPDAFDIARTTSREHVSFGFGAHFCLGARLAKMETEIALRALLRRYPDLRPASEPARLTSISLQGYQSLPVHLHGGGGTPTGALSVDQDAAVTA
ncbi:cytochrome P450 [Streptomyces sp. NPDC002889]|uniref:cytochrome P450 family protein n=1 Tax=Streptomyces sp. NPDC002889 TaxID=3364669 RepID=UPI0036A9B6E6